MLQKYPRLFAFLFGAMEVVLLLGAFFLLQVHSFLGSRQFPHVTMFTGAAWGYAPGLGLAFFLLVILIVVRGMAGEILGLWRQNLALGVFVLVAIASLSWSVYFDATLYKLAYFVFAAVLASYLAARYRIEGVLRLFTQAGMLSVFLSVILLLLVPNAVMMNEPYVGSWRGMFWHRNHAGDLNAFFNALFLFGILFQQAERSIERWLAVPFYVVSLALVLGSRSATGIVVFLVLHAALVAGFVWLKWNNRIKRWHYFSMAGVLVLGLVVFLANPAFFFGLLGRSASMTGRTPLWTDLLSNVWTQKPVLGYGYGALWMQESFRYWIADRQGWKLFPVFFADNGFLDILLNLGLAGFIPFAVMYLTRWFDGLRVFIKARQPIRFFLPLIFLYVLVGNLSYSFLLEVDQFVWLLLVTAVFLATRDDSAAVK